MTNYLYIDSVSSIPMKWEGITITYIYIYTYIVQDEPVEKHKVCGWRH